MKMEKKKKRNCKHYGQEHHHPPPILSLSFHFLPPSLPGLFKTYPFPTSLCFPLIEVCLELLSFFRAACASVALSFPLDAGRPAMHSFQPHQPLCIPLRLSLLSPRPRSCLCLPPADVSSSLLLTDLLLCRSLPPPLAARRFALPPPTSGAAASRRPPCVRDKKQHCTPDSR